MSSDKHIKETVEKLIKLLPGDFSRMPPRVQVDQLERVLNQIDGIAWLLVAEGRWDRRIGKWVQERESELKAAQFVCRQKGLRPGHGINKARQPQGAARDA